MVGTIKINHGFFIGYPVTSDIVLEAKFTEISYELAYSLDNGSFTTDFVPTAYTINTQTFIIPQPIREGFVFAGWTYGNLYTPTRDIVISQGNHESYQFHANWWELNDTVKVKAALPSLGNPNVLVVLVHWQDENLIHTTYDELKSNFFSESNDISTSYGLDSVSSFLNRSSYGKVSLSGDVFEYTTLKNNAEYLNFHEVANEVIDYFEDIVTWDDYDSNLDSYIDGIYIVFEDYPNYGGPNFVTTINRNVANKTIMKIASISSPGVEVLIHETIHMFGPPDIYAGVNVNPGGSKATSVMDQGLGDIPGIMKYVLGWIDQPIYVKTNELQTITLNSLSTHSNITIVYPNADETNKNWFIIEYITPEMNNAGYFDLGPLGGLRIWRTNMYIDNEGKINGIDLVEDGMMPSPYEYLEAVNDGDYNYFFFPGDEFTPYSYVSSYYGASYELIGKSTFINDIAFSGIYIDNIQLDGELATFDIRIEEEPQVLEINVNEYFNTTIEKGNFFK